MSIVQQEIHGYVLGLTSQGKRVAYLYGPSHLKFKYSQAYEEAFNLLPFDTSAFATIQPVIGSAPERPTAETMRVFHPVTPFVGLFDEADKKRFKGVSGPGQTAPPPTSAPQQPTRNSSAAPHQGHQAPATQQQVWYPRNDEEWALYDALTDQNLDAWGRTYDKVDGKYPDKDEEFRRNVTTAVVIETARQVSGLRGWVVGKVVAPPDPRDEVILQTDPFNTKNDLLARIAGTHDHINAGTHAANILGLFGFNGSHITGDQESWLNLAHIAWDYSDLRVAGKDEKEAVHEVAAKYNIPPEVLKV